MRLAGYEHMLRCVLVAAVLLVSSGCGAQRETADARAADAAPTGVRVRVRWNLVKAGLSVSCAEVGGSQVRLDYYDGTDVESFPCASGEAVTRELAIADYFVVGLTIADSDGNMLAWDSHVEEGLLVTPGAVVEAAAIVVEFFDEPERQLRAIAAGAQAFFPQPPAVDSQFPAGTGVTPAVAGCCAQEGNSCAPNDIWSGSWKQLGFNVPGWGRWVYQFESSGAGYEATFVAKAFADVDCDMVIAHYELHGHVDATGAVVVDDQIMKIVANE